MQNYIFKLLILVFYLTIQPIFSENNNPEQTVVSYLLARGYQRENLPLEDPVWRQTIDYLKRNDIKVEFSKLSMGDQGIAVRAFRKNPLTGERLFDSGGEALLRGGKIQLSLGNVEDPRQVLSTLVHETNHLRRWISSGERTWTLPSEEKSMTFKNFQALNRLNVAGDESLAFLRAAKFSKRNGIPLTPIETEVLDIAEKGTGEIVRNQIREYLSTNPFYQEQHRENLQGIFNSIMEDRKSHPKRNLEYYKKMNSADLLSLSRLRTCVHLFNEIGSQH